MSAIKILSVNERERNYRDNFSGKKSRVYFSIVGEGAYEQLISRRSRPHRAYRKEVMPKVLKELGYKEDSKYSWSQKCGCSCGCSPGFIMGNHYGKNIYVTISVGVSVIEKA